MTPMNFDAYARRQAHALFDTLADRLVKDLAQAASEEAQASAAQARQDAEQAAETALAAARAEGEARLASAQAMNAGLLETLEAVREEVRTTQAAAQEEVRSTQAAAQEEVRSTQAAAQEELRAAQSAAQAEIARVRAELETRLDEREQALQAARQDARLAEEALESARQESAFARIEAEACRQDRELVVDRVRAALAAIDRATGPGEILETLIEPLEHEFSRAAVFMVGPSSLTGWRARGLDPATDITKLVILRANNSPLTRAVTERKRLLVTATPNEPLSGVLGMSDHVRHAVALPVLAGGQVIAVAYAEDIDTASSSTTFQEPPKPFPSVACKVTEMLIDHAMLRLTTKRATADHAGVAGAAQPEAYSPARQARRLKVQNGIDVTLDGAEGSLVDLSSIGAQILSPLAMPPNRLVKMTLRTRDAALACRGRVIWARFEQPRGAAAARYRVGVKFTDVNAKALDGLMSRHGIAEATG